MQNDLRWLLRRGSPLPIPNREVKSDCADGTAVMWESMSPPFLVESLSEKTGFLVFKRFGAVVDSCRRLFLTRAKRTDEVKPCSNERGFLFYMVLSEHPSEAN